MEGVGVVERLDRYHKEVGPFGRWWIFDSLGNEREATRKECIALEPAVVWEPRSAEERLLDGLMGRPNAVLERIKRELEQ